MREYKKILACLDLTDGSEKIAAARQGPRGLKCGAQVILLHVVEYVPVEPMGEALLPAVQIEGELVDRATQRIAELAATLRSGETRSASCGPATSRARSCGSRRRRRST